MRFLISVSFAVVSARVDPCARLCQFDGAEVCTGGSRTLENGTCLNYVYRSVERQEWCYVGADPSCPSTGVPLTAAAAEAFFASLPTLADMRRALVRQRAVLPEAVVEIPAHIAHLRAVLANLPDPADVAANLPDAGVVRNPGGRFPLMPEAEFFDSEEEADNFANERAHWTIDDSIPMTEDPAI